MAADGSGLLEQLLHSDADVHGTRWFGTNPSDRHAPTGQPSAWESGAEAGAGGDPGSCGQAPSGKAARLSFPAVRAQHGDVGA
jgi:hypothetical protein